MSNAPNVRRAGRVQRLVGAVLDDRADFEAWLKENGYAPERPTLMLMWLAWQAAWHRRNEVVSHV